MAIFSTIATSSLEEVAEAAPNATRWFQLYIYKDRKITESIVRRAENAGFKALVLTVDAPFFGLRRLDLKNKFSLPPHLTLANFQDVVLSEGGEGEILHHYPLIKSSNFSRLRHQRVRCQAVRSKRYVEGREMANWVNVNWRIFLQKYVIELFLASRNSQSF